MIQQLKSYYGEDMCIAELHLCEEYKWFLVDGKKVGIRRKRLHKNENDLLTSILTPIDTNTFYKTKAEKTWYEILYQNKTITISSMQFLHFFMNQTIIERDEFQNALQSMFPFSTTVVWENSQAGVVILTAPSSDYSLQAIIDTLEADFFVSISFFIGKLYTQATTPSHLYQWERNFFSSLSPYLSKKIISMEHILPYQFITALPKHEKEEYIKRLLQNIQDDKELIHTIQVFFQCNLNVSLAAKQLYLHRNTLQYRIDKFIEKTGINIKTFEGAVAVYMAFLTLQISHKPKQSYSPFNS
ncbi:PucR family transcriptional regulator [Bacillus gaemokensis]|uniref:PucR family transcriptional regulator n=1 Tax=Bacillus gaemokensis TaxID=574375 RepID=UPI00069076A7|nr:helix-turn-helix domain-containing protein [Bacillus gaemokensis]KYG28859.1 Fis family transcriptional regulator [Bacillus gaemokensis]